jgi:hypothetical protein
MSTMITSRPSTLPKLDRSERERVTVSEPERLQEPSRVARAVEPPERFAVASEEPELKSHCRAEAPDAGEGGFDRNESDFRLGRSRG